MSASVENEAVSYEELDSDFENDFIDIDSTVDVDSVLTDDLLEDSDSDKKKKTKKTLTKKKAPVKRKAPVKKATTLTQSKLNLTETKVNTILASASNPLVQPVETYNIQKVKELSEQYPDQYWQFHADGTMLNAINEANPLQSINYNLSDQAAISSMALSEDGTLLATFSSTGCAKVYEAGGDFQLLVKLRDTTETQIDEFLCGAFLPNGCMAVGGKSKDRHRWSEEDQDNHILPCDVKIFDMETTKVITRLAGHTEEILTTKAIQFKGENYLITTSQDGSIIKWHLSTDWKSLLDKQRMDDNITCMAFTVSFLPNTGNKYFLAATDEHLRLYDFESGKMLQTFAELYTCYCDCGKFVKWLDEPKDQEHKGGHAYFITRGTELCDVSEGVSSAPNSCKLHKLVYPTTDGEEFKLELVRNFQHPEYHANSWSVKIASNGRYLLAPTIYGQIFVFNMLTGALTAIVKEHEDIEVRDVIFHPYRPLLFSCSDDGYVKIYSYKEEESTELIQQDLNVGYKGEELTQLIQQDLGVDNKEKESTELIQQDLGVGNKAEESTELLQQDRDVGMTDA